MRALALRLLFLCHPEPQGCTEGAEHVKTAQSDGVQSPRAILQYSFLWDHSWACWDGLKLALGKALGLLVMVILELSSEV